MVSASKVYHGSDGGVTRSFCCRLKKCGHVGQLAAALFMAQKYSSRAKTYQDGIDLPDGRKASFTDLTYQKKNKHLEALCRLLSTDSCGFAWGWGKNPRQRYASYVLYVELPQGQVSFHSPTRIPGPEFPGVWDGQHANAERVIAFCDALMDWAMGVPAEPVVAVQGRQKLTNA